MRILFIGDPHLKINRFDLALQFLTWMNETVKVQKPDMVINLGDTFDTHAVVRTEIMKEFKDHVDFCLNHTSSYYYILGNHDAYKPKDSKYHALQTMTDNSKFIVIDKVVEGHGMTFIPYQSDVSKFPMNTQPICIAHQAFVGADFGG